MVKHNDPENGILGEWESYFNVGADYTFRLGNGLNLTSEFFRYNSSRRLSQAGAVNNFSVLAVNYPFGLMNSISGAVYYNWNGKEWYRFINLKRDYDYWSFYLMLFWNPERFYLYSSSSDRNLLSGKGIQVMAVVNF